MKKIVVVFMLAITYFLPILPNNAIVKSNQFNYKNYLNFIYHHTTKCR